jgi:hypothetical protein
MSGGQAATRGDEPIGQREQSTDFQPDSRPDFRSDSRPAGGVVGADWIDCQIPACALYSPKTDARATFREHPAN